MREFLEELESDFPQVTTLYFLCSGGWDSTCMLMELHEHVRDKYDCHIVFNNTRLNPRKCVETVNRLSRITGFEIIELEPDRDHREIMREAFSSATLDRARKLVEEKRYHKRVFRCCHYLKEKPLNDFLRALPDRDSCVVLSGIKKVDGKQRRIFLTQLTKAGTYFRYIKRRRVHFGYPLRDVTAKEVEECINNLPFEVIHSGCNICPVLLLFDIREDEKRYAASVAFYNAVNG